MSCNAFDKSEKRKFDEMFDIPRLFISQLALLCAVQSVRLYPILLMPILLYCYKQLMECISEIGQLMVKVQDLQKVYSPQQSKLFDF
jgi:hypothetical protein